MREEQYYQELQSMRNPKITEYHSEMKLLPLHMRVDKVMHERKEKLHKATAAVEEQRKQKGIKTEDQIYEEFMAREAEKKERLKVTTADIEQKYQKSMANKRHKQM